MFEYSFDFTINKALLFGFEYFHNELHILSEEAWHPENWIFWIHIGPLGFAIERTRRA